MKEKSTWHSLCILVYTYGSLIKLHVEIRAIAFNLKVNPTFYNKFRKCLSEQQNHGRYWLLKPLRVWRLMIKELNRRSHPSSGSSLGHTVKTVATTARCQSLFWCLSMEHQLSYLRCSCKQMPAKCILTPARKGRSLMQRKFMQRKFMQRNFMQKKIGPWLQNNPVQKCHLLQNFK